ncbi:mitochondrial carrier protein, family 25 [Rhodotorula toruloides]|uniref:BY PROTMAP: gi/472583726/gb/EMS21350.1/ mitochondrial carrier protein, family 25 [Rhodosporidium toruloides NP11] gi/647403222/emb/CDR49364.1/ RHTO0S26e00254g1_1 [Rhodosporidium toruloides] n=2 Tax=Rhodotorula toruloides TaxID=5286 RepID=A0A0K3CC76_RHOTO|nr:mitochondrial carrier protein, family 25 [Rhodotorula toruloides]
MESTELAAGAAGAAVDSDDGRGRRAKDEKWDTTADLIAGWLGGAVGVLAGNPFEVLKVRLQTHPSSHGSPPAPKPASTSSPRVGKSSIPPLPSPSFPFPPPPTPLGATGAAPPLPAVASPIKHTSSTLMTPSPTPSALSSSPAHTSNPSASSSSSHTKVGLISLYRSEGIRFFFAGTAGPILGLAFIDSAFFGLYGRMMQALHQDRQDPNALSRVFASGATAGALCALLETPIEVVKTRAQVESVPGKKLGSFRIASQIARKEGLRGFYIGGLMTAVHDGISSGIFFWGYFVFRRMLRGEDPFHAASANAQPPPASTIESFAASTASSSSSSSPSSAPAWQSQPQPDTPAPIPSSSPPTLSKTEILRILFAGGCAGALSALIPYPFDIVKTRLQTANFESRARSSPVNIGRGGAGFEGRFTSNATPFHTRVGAKQAAEAVEGIASASGTGAGSGRMTVPSVFRGIHADGVASYRYRYPSTLVYQLLSTWVFPQRGAGAPGKEKTVLDPRAEKWALRVLGFKGFARGLRPTVVSSFVGSAATITTVEIALHFLGVSNGGGVG